MHPAVRLSGIVAVFVATSIAWLILGGITQHRSETQTDKLGGEINDLWGRAHYQNAPALSFQWKAPREVTRTETQNGVEKTIKETIIDDFSKEQLPISNTIGVDLALDQRLKGLMWYSLYDVRFNGLWRYVHHEATPGTLRINFQFPDAGGVYDDFHFYVDGRDYGSELRPSEGRVEVPLAVIPGQEVVFSVAYKSRGKDEWRYVPAQQVASLKDFELTMNTDFTKIDFPAGTMSPSSKDRTEKGFQLKWKFAQVVTGHAIGMSTPSQIQPGELASSLAYSAPISLLFFFLLIFVLSTLKKIDIHPVNYLFLGGAFFAFHLLFSYSVDHLPVVGAFALASCVSVFLVVSYLRLVVSPKFAFLEAGAAQLVYLIGFSLAHFWDGFTGLTVTVLSIMTLFLLMQLTGRIRWGEALRSPQAARS
jgi:inner membrane protein involved in colicin E2 resistance